MKIALIAPSPVPFAIGGAENLWTGWLAALNAEPGVQADLIKLPSPERDFWEIAASYRRFAELDLTHFDRVISTKYPAWMVAHPDHHLFLQHKLRGLYDTWPARLDTRVHCDHPSVTRLLRLLASARGRRAALADMFAALDDLRAVAPALPPALFHLPGALIRTLVHELDAIGLSKTAIRRYAAISATVAARADYFPPEVDPSRDVAIHHHPSLPRPLAEPHPDMPPGAIFTASRLDAPKRIDWIIRAYLKAGLERPLAIAGDGPQRQALFQLAGQHPGIRLLGRLTDAQLAAAYRDCAYVVFVPDREDYGLITLEALQAGKPVITLSDSGGTTELIRDGHNGLIAAPNEKSLATAMSRLGADSSLRERLAAAAAPSVAHISWPGLARAFVHPQPRILVVNTFSIHPPRNGGQLRMFQLYRQLAAGADRGAGRGADRGAGRGADLRLVNLCHANALPGQRALAPGLVEHVIPMSPAHARAERALQGQLGASCGDIAALLHPELTPAWLAAIADGCAWADCVIACHPYAYPAIRRLWDGPVVYESLNVELDLKRAIYPEAAAVLEQIERIEGDCARQAPLVTCCSEQDASRMAQLYGLATPPIVVPNGVDAGSYASPSHQASQALRQRLGLGDTQVALFVGSLHGPNIAALRALYPIAKDLPDLLFVVLGSVCEAADLAPPPANLCLIGRVSDQELRVWLAAASVGINPVETGSGTNLKLLEYAAAGLPILSTAFGARGGILQAGEHFVQAPLAEFSAALRELLSPTAAVERARRAERARARARERGDWRRIAADYGLALSGVINPG
ncbi:Glycosyltransferase KanE [Thiorhodovibrio winogradskyi]|uniref:Glycosyltransferase KanE n=1 Tax=Thiorhodovibrio winogradskyi TaxID=77007 RepID=A0ABZ0S3A8_9GAMM|nr:glycosyltransferase family 4 protein [Thiorhodovibrio winogradskyi]